MSETVFGFSPFVQEQVGWYVYLLRDPRSGVIFYVGKGKGNRVFQHAKDALDDAEAKGAKLNVIRSIHAAGLSVQAEILRHNIPSESMAYVVEAAVIDALDAIRPDPVRGVDLKNIVVGHHKALYGHASVDVVASIYDAPPFSETDEPIVFLKIPQLWTPAMSADELFEAARGWWKTGKSERIARARYAIAVNRGVTRGVYRIDYWRERVEGDRDFDHAENPPRLGFWGKPAPEMDHFLNRSIKAIKQGTGAVVIYHNVDPSEPALAPVYRGADAVARAADER